MKKLIILLLSALLMVSGFVEAAQFTVPDENPWAPVYARTITHPDSEWVVTYLYRERSCVPDDFDIWGDFFDISGAAFNCPFLMDGIVVQNPDIPGPPRHSNLSNQPGVLIPVIFVSADDWADLVADGTVTVPELEAAPSALVGWADHHKDILKPLGGQTRVVSFNYVGRGTLMDGRSFHYHITGQFRDNTEQIRVFNVTMR